mmetsp:Transcript_11760/g.24269  ORF Transcript_11760/g.24269 Transcript_11760/m.24269 type:complete len:281 (+) Transcript_11760:97-939(+)
MCIRSRHHDVRVLRQRAGRGGGGLLLRRRRLRDGGLVLRYQHDEHQGNQHHSHDSQPDPDPRARAKLILALVVLVPRRLPHALLVQQGAARVGGGLALGVVAAAMPAQPAPRQAVVRELVVGVSKLRGEQCGVVSKPLRVRRHHGVHLQPEVRLETQHHPGARQHPDRVKPVVEGTPPHRLLLADHRRLRVRLLARLLQRNVAALLLLLALRPGRERVRDRLVLHAVVMEGAHLVPPPVLSHQLHKELWRVPVGAPPGERVRRPLPLVARALAVRRPEVV